MLKRPGRRAFLRLLPAAIGAGAALPRIARAGTEPQGVTKETLECAERLAGVAFSDAEHELMRQSVATNRDHSTRCARSTSDTTSNRPSHSSRITGARCPREARR